MTAPAIFTTINPAGMNGTVSANTGNHANAVWQTVDIVKDVDLGDEVEFYKASIRRTAPFNVYIATMRDINPKFKIAWINTDANFIALLNAYQNGTALDMVFADGPFVSGAQGPRADWGVAKFAESQHLTEGTEVDVELKPMLTANVPSWYVHA